MKSELRSVIREPVRRLAGALCIVSLALSSLGCPQKPSPPSQVVSKASTDAPNCQTITIDLKNNVVTVDVAICYAEDGDSPVWTTVAKDDFTVQFNDSPFASGNKTVTKANSGKDTIKGPGKKKARILPYSITYKGYTLDPQIIIGGGGN